VRYLALAALLATNVYASADCDPARLDRWLTVLRETSAEGAAEIGYSFAAPETQCDLPPVIQATNDAIPHVRTYAAHLLGETLISSETIVPALIRLLKDEDDSVRSHAVLALIKRGGEAAESLVALAHHRRDEMSPSYETHIADYAIFALSQIGTPAVAVVISAVRTGKISVQEASTIFSEMDDSAAAAIAATLKDEPALQSDLLVTIDPDPEDHEACSLLSSYLDDPTTRDSAMSSGKRCPEVASWVAKKTVCDESTFEKMLLWAAPTDAARVVQSCGKAGRLPFESFSTARMTSMFIRNLEPGDLAATLSKDLSSFVDKGLNSPKSEARRAAVELLGALATGDKAKVAELVPFVTDLNPAVRETAHDALRWLGTQAHTAADPLWTVLEQGGIDDATVAGTLLTISAPEDVQSHFIPLLLDRRTRYAALAAAEWRSLDLRPIAADIEKLSATVEPSEAFLMAKLLAKHEIMAPLLRIASDKQSAYQHRAIEELLLLNPHDEEGALHRRALLQASAKSRDLVRTFSGRLSDADAALLGTIATSPSRDFGDRQAALEVLRRAGVSGRGAAIHLRAHRFGAEDAEEIRAITLFAVDPSPETAHMVVQSLNQKTSSWRFSDRLATEDALDDVRDLRYDYLVPLLGTMHGPGKLLLLRAFEKQSVRDEFLPYLLDVASDEDTEIRTLSAAILKSYSAESAALETLSCLLSDGKRQVREAAAEALSAMPAPPRGVDAIIRDRFVRDHTASGAWSSGQRLHGVMRPPAACPGCVEDDEPSLPTFSLPPPHPSAYDVIDRRLFGRDHENLQTVHSRLAGILRSLGYQTQSLLRVPGGFALMTLIERIDEGGKPYKPPARWTRTRVPPRSLRQYLEVLFAEKPGRFRLFVFIVTPRSYLGQPTNELSEGRADSMLQRGGRVLPSSIANRSFENQYCHVLVYTYEKRPGKRASLVNEDPLQLAGHLTGAGITALLSLLR
jgi:HEAT repeat protein